MALVTRTVIIGNTLKFVRDGLSDTNEDPAVNVSATHVPDAGSPVWESFGVVEDLEISNKVESLRLKAPSTGRYRLRKTIPLSQELMLKASMQDANQLAFESLFLLAGAITIGTPAEPMKQAAPITGWVYLSQADQTDTVINLIFLRVEFKVTSHKSAEKEYKYTAEFEVLGNALNTYELDAFAAN